MILAPGSRHRPKVPRRVPNLRDRHHGYLNAGGTLENAQAMAAHESPTKLYDRTGDEITLDEVGADLELCFRPAKTCPMPPPACSLLYREDSVPKRQRD